MMSQITKVGGHWGVTKASAPYTCKGFPVLSSTQLSNTSKVTRQPANTVTCRSSQASTRASQTLPWSRKLHVSLSPSTLPAAAGSPPEPLIWFFNPVVAEVFDHQSQQKPRENSPEISTEIKTVKISIKSF
ncbi:hypothetical protein VNO78_20628 [Psophocarpus tetragonolobus]|uniref:Uncharacterized protein n=1 Tax=Psophocarpus tetragonolobus TaxID=3891 RepID=A0AAN9XHN4_PSOTE